MRTSRPESTSMPSMKQRITRWSIVVATTLVCTLIFARLRYNLYSVDLCYLDARNGSPA